MIALGGLVVGLLAAIGVWLAVAGGRVRPDPPRRKPAQGLLASRDGHQVLWRAALVVGAGAVGWAIRGWPAAGAIAAGGAWVVPLLVEARRGRVRALERIEAIASWAEMLRDTIAAQAGLREAVAVSAPVALAPIRAEVQALAVRAEREPLAGALRRFAGELADPLADLVVAALVVASERQARNLTDLLGQISKSARDQAAMRIRVETGRARTYATAKWMVILTGLAAAALLVYGGDFMAPYETAIGQLVLVVIGALFAAALFGLVQLGRAAPAPRLLAGVERTR